MNDPDYDAMADRAHPNPYDQAEAISEAKEFTCDKCGGVYILWYLPDGNVDMDRPWGGCEFHLRVVCSWCSKAMGYKPCTEEVDGQISHGMCVPCGEKFKDEMERQV